MLKAVLFDFWDTVVISEFSNEAANCGCFEYVTKNPNGVTGHQVTQAYKQYFDELRAQNPINGPEFVFEQLNTIIDQRLGLTYGISYLEREYVFIKKGHSNLRIPPNLEKLLAYLKAHNYRIGIVSNTIMHSATQIRVLKELYHPYPFEFVVSSSETVWRKPDVRIFEVALKKLGLKADEVLFVGDNFEADVEGSLAAGMQPVYYNRKEIPATHPVKCLEIHDYQELLTYLQHSH